MRTILGCIGSQEGVGAGSIEADINSKNGQWFDLKNSKLYFKQFRLKEKTYCGDSLFAKFCYI